MSALSRRNLFLALGGIAAAPALPVPVQAAQPRPISSDPIFAALEGWIRLDKAATALAGTEAGDAATLAAYRARRLLAMTSPTTLAGLARYTAFLGEQSADLGRTEFFFEVDELEAYAASISRTAALLAQ